MSAIEINKLIASILVAGLIFMAINVGVDEIFHRDTVAVTIYPVPKAEAQPAAVEEPSAAEKPPVQSGPDVPRLLAAADPEAGQKIARVCSACHDFSRGGRNKAGPNLWDIVGAKVAAREGFKYSSAMAGLDGTWGYDQLFAFLTKPKQYLPGTKMSFSGIRKPAALANLLALLRTLSDNPEPLPAVE